MLKHSDVLKNLIVAYAEHGEVYDPEDDGCVIVVAGGGPDADFTAETGRSLAPWRGADALAGGAVVCFRPVAFGMEDAPRG